MSADEIIRMISNLGFPIVIALALGYTVWKLGGRIVEAQIHALDKACDRFDSVARSMSEITDSQSKICARLDQMSTEMHHVCKSK